MIFWWLKGNECRLQNFNELPENSKGPKEKYVGSILTIPNKVFYLVGVSQHKRDMKNLERVQKGIIIPEVKKLKPGMKKGTV